MVCLSNDPVIHLERGGLIRLDDGVGSSVACIEGAVWITQDYDRRDIVLTAGETYVVECPGLTVVCAIAGPAALTIGQPVVAEASLAEALKQRAA
ncbi:MAG: DUF2917 domain-containing protein [Rhizobiales bacterium]|nr:DUF2917 domain-containing protein [Hyphomicrobiales bacterium]